MTTPAAPPLTPEQIVRRLRDLGSLLDGATTAVIEADEKHVRAKQAYEVTFARATIEADGPADVRKASSTLQSADQRLEMEITGAQLRAVKSRIDLLETQIRVAQSISAATRAEWSATMGGVTT